MKRSNPRLAFRWLWVVLTGGICVMMLLTASKVHGRATQDGYESYKQRQQEAHQERLRSRFAFEQANAELAKEQTCFGTKNVAGNGVCSKTCPGEGIVNSENIGNYKDCTIIDGSLEILDQTFNGYQQVFANFSFGPRYSKIHPDQLEVFSTVQEITGYINIQGNHPDFTNLSYFRNLEVVGGKQLKGSISASVYILQTSLRSLELKSLHRVESGSIVILENSNLCFADEIDWSKIKKTNDQQTTIYKNRNTAECHASGMICSEECTSAGCWGKGPEQCLEQKNTK